MGLGGHGLSLLLVDQVSAFGSLLVNEEAFGHELVHFVLLPKDVLLGLRIERRLLFLTQLIPLLTNKLGDLGDTQRWVLFSQGLLNGVGEEYVS